MKKQVTLYFNSGLLHFTQLVSGLEFLHSQGEINLNYCLESDRYPIDIFRMKCNDQILFFDMADNAGVRENLYENCDFYLKRMLLKKDFLNRNKLLPYGLNYQVFYRNKFLKYLFLRDRKYLKYSLRYSPAASSLLNIKDCINNNELVKMQSVPSTEKQILFRSRLWNPDNNSMSQKKEDRKLLNRERIEINRKLKEKYANNFSGGIQEDEFSVQQCKELLLPDKEYHKKNYVKLLKRSSIGIVNRGLEGSISWKFGEYVAHSMAIISTPIDEFQLLGPLKKNEHYLAYNTPEECLEKTEILFGNDRLRKNMQQANREYYENWLHPGMKMRKILERIENK